MTVSTRYQITTESPVAGQVSIAAGAGDPTFLIPYPPTNARDKTLLLVTTISGSETVGGSLPTVALTKSGWNAVSGGSPYRYNGTDGSCIAAWTRQADGTDEDNPVVVWGNIDTTATTGDSIAGQMFVLPTGTRAEHGNIATTNFGTATSLIPVASGMFPPENNALQIGITAFVNDTPHTYSPPAGWTELGEYHTALNRGHGAWIGYKQLDSSGATAAANVVPSDTTSSKYTTITFTVRTYPDQPTRMVTERGDGNYSAGAVHTAGTRWHYPSGSRRGVIFIPGWTGSGDHWFTLGQNQSRFTYTVMDDGYPVATLGEGSGWGNAASRARIDDLKSYCETNYGWQTSPDDEVHLVGISAGSLHCLRWAEVNPTLVRSLTLILPLVDVQDVYDEDPAGIGIQASISTAYGGRPSDAQNPVENPSYFDDIPIKMWYSANDEICDPGPVATFEAAVPSATAVALATQPTGLFGGGHSIDGLDPQDILDWIIENDA